MQRMRIVMSVALCALAGVLLLPPAASAEWFTDFSIGGARTQNTKVEFKLFDETIRQDVDTIGSVSVGVRGGRWLDDIPWLGFALSASYFNPARDIFTVPLTALVMARYGLMKDDEFKEGRLQPYAGLGGGLFISRANGTIGFIDTKDTSADLGLDVRLGVAHGFYASGTMKIFGFVEYRFTHVSPSFDVKTFDNGTTPADTTFNTHHVVLGVSFRF
jgi:opacity protein-like surface antigen